MTKLLAGHPAALTDAVEAFGAAVCCRILWRQAGPEFIPYYKVWTRDVHLPRPSKGDYETVAGALHEMGHSLAGPCGGEGIHARDKKAHRLFGV
jgi:hypothetical protein